MLHSVKSKRAKLPMDYEVYVFDLYGTLVDIHTDENDMQVWEKLSFFYGYYGAHYEAEELKKAYGALVSGKEKVLKSTLEDDPKYSHEASPEIEITEVFKELYERKGVAVDEELARYTGQVFRAMTTEYVRTYKGTEGMLSALRAAGKRVYLLSNAQRIFTAYEMQMLDIVKYFDGILISSDYRTKKPDVRFFDALIEEYEVKPERVLFVGNDMRCDMQGAMNAGFHTYYVESNISPQDDVERHGKIAKAVDYLVLNFYEWYC